MIYKNYQLNNKQTTFPGFVRTKSLEIYNDTLDELRSPIKNNDEHCSENIDSPDSSKIVKDLNPYKNTNVSD